MSSLKNKTIKSPLSFLIGLFFMFIFSNLIAQKSLLSPADTLNNKRLNFVRIGGLGGSVVVLGSLSYAWYSDYDAVPFHFFDDSKEWLAMDKIGHGLTSYYGGLYGYKSMKWAGVSEKKSIWYGGLYGWTFLLGTEFLDGISSGWGASPSDLLSNTLGASMFISQQLGWKEQRIILKFSYWPTKFAKYRPNLLGDTHWNRWLKDYNGQTYWLSANLDDFGVRGRFIPKWLNVALGYSVDGLIGGNVNPLIDASGNPLPFFDRKKEFYFSLDIDLKKIKTRSKMLKSILYTASFIKIPFPALGFSNGKFKLHYLHY
tara:strand:- start:168 stop:1112 length:945 start_codon:yes stop_codon:yes gene_type:complete